MNEGHVTRRKARAILAALQRMEPAERARVVARLPEHVVRAIEEEWWWQAHGGQIEPGEDWRIWLIMAGRGFGKTRAGAEWVWARARAHPEARIALVGGTLDEIAKVMVEGESGLISCARPGERPGWVPSRKTLTFPSGAVAFAYSAERPGQLRGPQHDFAWCDELAKWREPLDCWNNLRLGLRLGTRPRVVVTTTPQPGPALKAIMALNGIEITHGRTAENPHSAPDFRSAMVETYGGTRLGRQELDGVLFDDVEGAFWEREAIEDMRVTWTGGGRGLARIVIGVDPPASAGGTCGILACGMDGEGIAYVLGDHSIAGATPNGWARKVAAAAEIWGADRVIAEKNNGGDMVGSTLAAAAPGLPVKLVSASRGKAARAEPIATRFEAAQAKFAGHFPELEDELCGMTAGGYHGPGGSPDRADAMVWAMTELFARPRAEPRIVRL